MYDTSTATSESGSNSEHNAGESRRARSIRFSESDWETVEIALAQRAVNSAKFARDAALGITSDHYGDAHGPLPSQCTNLIERIFRSTHILASAKRDDMICDGCGDEHDDLVTTTRELQDSLPQATHGGPSIDAGTSRS